MKKHYKLIVLGLGIFLLGALTGFLTARLGGIKFPGEESTATVYISGYSYFDNTPTLSSRIAFSRSRGLGTVHEEAGGEGTYNDPLPIAVGHVIVNGIDTPDFTPGTRFYIPDFKKYFI